MPITYSQEEIYPSKAKDYLADNIANRPIRKQTVLKYARDMKSGDWDMNGEDLIFDWNGHLRNGQHRLLAVIEADVPIKFGVKRGVDPSTFKTMDNNVSRSPGDVLSGLGFKYGNHLASAARIVMAYLARRQAMSGSFLITKTELIDFIATNKELAAMVEHIHNHKYPLSTAPIAAVMFLSNREGNYDTQWKDFLHALRTGASLAEGSPILSLRNWTFNRRTINKHISGDIAFIAIARAWNAAVTGTDLRAITTNTELSKINVIGYVDKERVKAKKPKQVKDRQAAFI